MAIANGAELSRPLRHSRANAYVLIEQAASAADAILAPAAETKGNAAVCRVGEAVQDILSAASSLAQMLQSPQVSAAHLIMAILGNEAARAELQSMGVRIEHARAACYAYIGAQGAAGSGTGLHASTEAAMKKLLRRAMEKASGRHEPELRIVGTRDLCEALIDISKQELRIKMLLQGTRPLSGSEIAVREAERNILQRLSDLEKRAGAAAKVRDSNSKAIIRMWAGIALVASVALVSWHTVNVTAGWATALSWLGRALT